MVAELDHAWLLPLLPPERERRAYLDATRRLCMKRELSALRVAHLSSLRVDLVRRLMAADPRFVPVPRSGPALFTVREEYRHASKLRALVTTIPTTTPRTPEAI